MTGDTGDTAKAGTTDTVTDGDPDAPADTVCERDGSEGCRCDTTPVTPGAWLGFFAGLVAVARRRRAA